MEERVLKEIINDFYKKEMLDEDIEESKKQELYGRKMDEIRLEIDSMVLDIEKELRDNGEDLGTSELKEIRHSIVLALDRMNKRGVTVLDGRGKIDSEAVKKIIKEENSKVEEKVNYRENIEEPIDIAEVKTKENDENALFEKLKELNLSEEDFEYYSGAIERERERERKRQQDIESMGEEKANTKALEEFSKDTGAQCDALAVAAVRSGKDENIRRVDDLRKLHKEMEYYQVKGEEHLSEQETIDFKILKDNFEEGRQNLGLYFTEMGWIPVGFERDFFEVNINSDKAATRAFVLGTNDNDYVELPQGIVDDSIQQQIESAKANRRDSFLKNQKKKKYDEIRSIDEISSLIEEGVSRREIANALKIFADIVNKSRDINELENKIETRIKEDRGEPLSEDEILILRTFRKMDYEGESLDEILQSEKKDELIDRFEEIAERIETEQMKRVKSMTYEEGYTSVTPETTDESGAPKKEELNPISRTISEQERRYTTPLHEMRHATVDERKSEEDTIGKEYRAIKDQRISEKILVPYFEEKNEVLTISLSKENMYTDIPVLGKNGDLYGMRDGDTEIIENKNLSVTPPSAPISPTPPPPPASIVEEMTVDGSGTTQVEQSESSKKGTLSASTMKALVESQAEARKMLEASEIIHGQTPERPTTGKTETRVAPVADNDEKSGGEPEEH